MKAFLAKPKREVCKNRAAKAASDKYDSSILEKREEYAKSRNIKFMQEAMKLSRAKKAFYEEAYNHYMKEYVHAQDSISDKVPEKIKKSYGLKEFSDYIIDKLSDI